MLDLLELYLIPNGYRCVKCESGQSAVRYLENDEVDIVLLDVMMPEMDGWETCKQIRKFSNVPIIMVTARDATTDVVQGLKSAQTIILQNRLTNPNCLQEWRRYCVVL